MTRASRYLVTSIGLALALASRSVQADEPTRELVPAPHAADEERAAELLRHAKARFSAGDDAAAIEALEEARQLSTSSVYVFNLGMVQQWAGHCEAAREAFDTYLQIDPDGEGQRDATRALDSLYTICGRKKNPPTTIAEPSHRTALPSVPPPGDTDGTERSFRALSVSLLVAGSATSITAIVSALVARRTQLNIQRLYNGATDRGTKWEECSCLEGYQRLETKRERFSTLSWTLGLGSVALLGAGTAFWLVEGASVSLSAEGLSYRGTF